MNDRGKKIWILVVGVIFIVFSYLFARKTGSVTSTASKDIFPDYLQFFTTIDFPIALTTWFIIAGTCFLFVLIFKKKWFFPDVKKLSPESARLIYFKSIDVIGIVFAGLSITLSILWTRVSTKGIASLQIQSLILLSFIIYIGISLFVTIFKDIKEGFIYAEGVGELLDTQPYILETLREISETLKINK